MNKFISILVRKYQISESFGRLIEDNIKLDRGMHEGLCGEGSFNKCNFYWGNETINMTTSQNIFMCL